MDWSELQVMVVEDHGFQRRIALRLLAELGVEQALEGADGLDALDVLRRQPAPPDVVLVDLDMPGMDGIECIGQIAQERLARAVVVVSALDPALLHTVQMMARAYGLRVLGSVEKPLTRDKLEEVLVRVGDHAGEQRDESEADFAVPALLEALDNGEILPWFQPQVEFGNGKVVGVEALARWERPDGSVVRPVLFVPLLEREGRADALTERMLDEGCRWLQRWCRDGMRLKLSVNVSPLALADPQAADRYQAIVESHAVSPEDVVLEITESSVMTDAARGLGRAGAAAAEGLRPVDRRLRHRLFLAGATGAGAIHRAEDRQGVRVLRALAAAQAGDGGSQPGPRAQARPDHGGGRRGNRRGLAAAGGTGLQHRPGLADRAAGPGQRAARGDRALAPTGAVTMGAGRRPGLLDR